MITFKKFMSEVSDKNIHLEHIEDEVFNSGISGAHKAIQFLIDIKNLLRGHTKSDVNITVKWDGAPSICCGANPENGKFFVGTKSLFNKDPKINYTNEDIEKNHANIGLQEKLKIALEEISKLNLTGILQGDILFTSNDLKKVDILGKPHLAFTPNTITYAVPYNSTIANKIKLAKIGIVFHTSYHGNNFANLKTSFGFRVHPSLQSVPSVWVIDAIFRDMSGSATLNPDDIFEINSMLVQTEKLFKQLSNHWQFVNSIAADKNLKMLIKTYINSQIRIGTGIESNKEYTQGLTNFIEQKFQKEIENLKTEKGKINKTEALKTLKLFLESNEEKLIIMFRMSQLITRVKTMLIAKMNTVKSLGTFLQSSNEFQATSPEGFVVSNRFGHAIKLVDRLEFSRTNFNINKSWAKEGI
jgi:hypothetical protein